jgi:hypothetical protein
MHFSMAWTPVYFSGQHDMELGCAKARRGDGGGGPIAALEGSASKLGEKKLSGAAQGAPASGGKQRPGITPGGRRRLSLALKKRWAERRKKGA